MADSFWAQGREFRGRVVKVQDGDTVIVQNDLGYRITHEVSFRIRGYNAPETRGEQKPEGLKWKAALEYLLPIGTPVSAWSLKDPMEKTFDRYVADIKRLSDGLMINAESVGAVVTQLYPLPLA